METTEEVTIDPWTQKRIDGLREALDILEANPRLANTVWVPSSLTAYTGSKERFDELRRMIGPHSKEVGEYSATASRKINDEFSLDVKVDREEVCTKVKTGEKLVEKEVLPEGVEMLTVVETVDVYEWVCPESWGEKS